MRVNRKHFMVCLAAAWILWGCAAIGTKTIYQTQQPPARILRMGYCDPPSLALLRTVYPQADSVLQEALAGSIARYGFQPVYMDRELPLTYIQADTTAIAIFCRLGDLDALLLPEFSFLNVTYTYAGIPIARNYDTRAEFKLYDRQGRMLAWISFDTFRGKSYLMPPSAERTLHDAALETFKQIAKNMGWRPAEEHREH